MAISGVGVRELPEAHTFDFIEETFRHSLGPGAVRGIAPRWERKGVGEPLFPFLFHGGRPDCGWAFLVLMLRWSY